MIELVVWIGFGCGQIVWRILIDWRFEGRCPCAGDLWRCDRLTDVIEYPLDRGWLGDKGDDPHLGPTVRAEKRKTFIDTRQ